MKFELLIGVVGTITLSGLLIVFNSSSVNAEESFGSNRSRVREREGEKELMIPKENIGFQSNS